MKNQKMYLMALLLALLSVSPSSYAREFFSQHDVAVEKINQQNNSVKNSEDSDSRAAAPKSDAETQMRSGRLHDLRI